MGVCRPKIRSAVGPGFGATVGSTGSVSAPGSVGRRVRFRMSVLHVTCGVCASLCGRLWVGMVERDVCEVRPCDPCARVCPVCVPAPPGVFLPV